MVYLVRAAVGKNDMDNKSVENCVCVLRNLSFRCQEVEDPDYDKHMFPPVQSRASAPIRGNYINSQNLIKYIILITMFNFIIRNSIKDSKIFYAVDISYVTLFYYHLCILFF